MPSGGVVARTPCEDVAPADQLIGKDFLVFEHFSFQRPVKRLREWIISTTASCTHRLGEGESSADSLKLRRGIHAAVIRVEDCPGEIAAGMVSIFERLFDEVGAQVVCDREANEHPRVAINHRSKIHVRPVRDRQIGNIADEDPIGRWRSEVALDQVSEYKAITLTLRCRDFTFFRVAAQLKLPHNPGVALVVDRTCATLRIVESQLGDNAFCAVELLLVVEDGLNLGPGYDIINQWAVPLDAATFPAVGAGARTPESGHGDLITMR